MVSVYLYGKFKAKVTSAGIKDECFLPMEVKKGDTIASIMFQLEITPDDVAHIFLNHQYSAPTRKVRDGDRLALFPREMSVLYRQYFKMYED